MKKALLVFALVLALCLPCFVGCDNEDGGNETSVPTDTQNEMGKENALAYSLNESGDSYSVTGIGECSAMDIVIPKQYNGLPVTRIGEKAFYNCRSLTSIEIGDSVESIGENAFSGCDSLESITIPFIGETKDGTKHTNFGYIFGSVLQDMDYIFVPESLRTIVITGGESIDKNAFSSLRFIESIIIPDTVTSIGFGAFWGCQSLTSIVIPDSVTGIDASAFRRCTNLRSVTIGNSVTSIGDSAFEFCDKLTSVHISDIEKWCNISFATYYSNPLHYAKNLFLNGELITELVVPESVTIIDDAFTHCTSLTSVVISERVTIIGFGAFTGCTNLASVVIPDSVTDIESEAFNDCTSLTSIEIPDSVTSIGNHAFSDCTSLTSVVIGDSVTSIGGYAFNNCTSLKTVYFTGSEDQWAEISIGSGNSPLTDATIVYNYVPEGE